MNFLRSVLAELFGMFVDDGSLAIAILLWVGAIAALKRAEAMPATWLGLLFFLGLAGLLVENVLRRARRQ